jgi:hypothetical protein
VFTLFHSGRKDAQPAPCECDPRQPGEQQPVYVGTVDELSRRGRLVVQLPRSEVDMTVAYPQAGVNLTLRQDRLDRLAVALGVRRVQPGGLLPALWHWTSIAPACATGTSVRVRLFGAPRAGSPVLVTSSAGMYRDENVLDLVQDSLLRVQTLTSRLPDVYPGAPLEAGDETLADDSVDIDALLSLFSADSGGSAANRVLGLLAAHLLRRRLGGQLIAVALNFWSMPGSLRLCRRVAWLDCEGRALFRAGTPGQPVSLTGTAWFGCGPGPR